jgi:hypothetical protein
VPCEPIPPNEKTSLPGDIKQAPATGHLTGTQQPNQNAFMPPCTATEGSGCLQEKSVTEQAPDDGAGGQLFHT